MSPLAERLPAQSGVMDKLSPAVLVEAWRPSKPLAAIAWKAGKARAQPASAGSQKSHDGRRASRRKARTWAPGCAAAECLQPESAAGLSPVSTPLFLSLPLRADLPSRMRTSGEVYEVRIPCSPVSPRRGQVARSSLVGTSWAQARRDVESACPHRVRSLGSGRGALFEGAWWLQAPLVSPGCSGVGRQLC